MKVLIVGPSWVGDMVMAQSLFTLLKQQNPDCEIDVLAPDWSRAILDRMPEVNQAISSPFAHGELALAKRWRLGRQLSKENYDRAYILPNSLKSALVPFFAKIPKRIAWRGEMRYGLVNDIRVLDKSAYPLMVQRFMALALPADHDPVLERPKLLLNSSSVQQQKVIEKFNLKTEHLLVALCPGAEFGPAKCWPAEYYAEVAKSHIAQGHSVCIVGSKKDQKIACDIQQLSGWACVDLTGGTSLEEAIDVLALANVVISNDSGLMHIAAALNKPVIAIYGSSSPDFTPPLADSVEIMQENIACSPCFKRTCPLQHFRCMKDLTPDRVLQAIARITA